MRKLKFAFLIILVLCLTAALFVACNEPTTATGGGTGPDTTLYLTYKKKADFLDSYIVFVQDDNTNYYHSYDCPKFNSSTFWAYSRSLAKSQGYIACPSCGGGE